MGEQSLYITPRTLLGIIRTAQAHAKCRFSTTVEQEDIDEAIRLIEACRDSFNDQLEKDKSKHNLIFREYFWKFQCSITNNFRNF